MRVYRVEVPVVMFVDAENEKEASDRVKWFFKELEGFGVNVERAEFLDVGEKPKPIDWRGPGARGT